MAANVLADAGFLVSLLSARDTHRQWATSQAAGHVPPWFTCEAVLSEAFHLLEAHGAFALAGLLRRHFVLLQFNLASEQDAVLTLMKKYSDVPMSLADACLVRMSEVLPDPIVLTTDDDFRIYRRHSRQVVPCVTPR
jgi:uncharacterized protein